MTRYVFTLDATLPLLNGNRNAIDLINAAEDGRATVFIPATVLAEVRAGQRTVEAILLTPGIHCVPLTEQAAVNLRDVAESLDDRHVELEAEWLAATVVAPGGKPWWGKGRPVLAI